MKIDGYLSSAGITQAAFASQLCPPVTQSLVSQWIKGKARIPLLRAIEIERITKKAVSVEDCAAMYGPQQEAAHA